MIFQPQGTGTTHKEGTIIVQSPKGTSWGTSNYVIDNYVSNLPTTGQIESKYGNKFNSNDTKTMPFYVKHTGTSGLYTIVTGIPGRQILIEGYALVTNTGTATVSFKSNNDYLISGVAYGAKSINNFSGPAAFRTNRSESFKIEVSSAVSFGGHVKYRIV